MLKEHQLTISETVCEEDAFEKHDNERAFYSIRTFND